MFFDIGNNCQFDLDSTFLKFAFENVALLAMSQVYFHFSFEVTLFVLKNLIKCIHIVKMLGKDDLIISNFSKICVYKQSCIKSNVIWLEVAVLSIKTNENWLQSIKIED